MSPVKKRTKPSTSKPRKKSKKQVEESDDDESEDDEEVEEDFGEEEEEVEAVEDDDVEMGDEIVVGRGGRRGAKVSPIQLNLISSSKRRLQLIESTD